MSAYYNEIDPFCCQWLKNLIAKNLIAPGEVDERDIRDVKPDDLRGFKQCHFFAGIGGWSYALRLAGWSDDREVWTGSCPCQPFSAAGKRAGFVDERHLWPAWFHLIGECAPATVYGEQVASPAGLGWFDLVHIDLEAQGYACGAADLCAAGVGASHIRQRLYFVAVSGGERREGLGLHLQPGSSRFNQPEARRSGEAHSFWSQCDWLPCRDGKSRPVEPGTFPLAHGIPGRVGRLRAYGNAIVPPLAAAFISAAMEAIP